MLFLALPLQLHLVELVVEFGELFPDVFQPLFGKRVRLFGERHFLDFELHYPAGDIVHLGGHRVYLGADCGARLVHEVNRLVGQKPVRNVAVRKRRRGNQRTVVNLHSVIHFVTLFESAEDGYRVLDRRFVHHNGLETAFQRGVLFDILAVLVQRGRADAVQFAAREHRFEQIARVHCAVRLARADYGVQFVYEKDNLSFALAYLVQHGFQPFLELAAEFRARNQRTHIQGENGLVFQTFGHVAAHNPLRKPLHDCGLAHAGFAYQHGIVLRLAGKYPDDVPYLVVASDDGVEFLLFRAFHEVETVFVQGVVSVFGLVARNPVRLHLFQLREKSGFGDAQRAEYVLYLLRGVVEQGEHNVLHGNVFVPLRGRKPLSAGKYLVRHGRDVNLVGFSAASAHRGHLSYRGIEHREQFVRVRPRLFQQSGDKPAVLVHEGVKQVLRHNLHILVFYCNTLRRAESFQRLFSEFLCVHILTSFI